MKAEFGRNSGAIIMLTTRSGTNDWHGMATDTVRNTKLNAVPSFQKTATGGTPEKFANGLPRKPQWNSNDFDANLGGPIIRDQTFFFGSYLGFRRRAGVRAAAIRGYHPIKPPAPGQPDPIESIILFFEEQIMPGYGWIFPISPTEANVGVGYFFDDAPTEKHLHRLLETFIRSREHNNTSGPANYPLSARRNCGPAFRTKALAHQRSSSAARTSQS